MTTYSQGFQSVWLEDIWSMEVAASSIVFHGPGADVSMSFMNPAAAEAEYVLVETIWEAAKATKPYDRNLFIRELMPSVADGFLSDETTLKGLAMAASREGVNREAALAEKVYHTAEILADEYEANN